MKGNGKILVGVVIMGVAAMMMLSIMPAMADSTLPQTDEHSEALCDALKKAGISAQAPLPKAFKNLLIAACK